MALDTRTDSVLQALHNWADAVHTRDPEKVLQLYHPDAVLWGTFSTVRRDSPKAIRQYFEHFLDHPGLTARIGDPLIRHYEHIAIATGYYSFYWTSEGSEEVTVHARYSYVFLQDGETWSIVDHHSSLIPEGP